MTRSLLALLVRAACTASVAAAVASCGPAPAAHVAAPLDASIDTHAVAVRADAPALGPVPVTANDPQWGDADAPVTIVEFADFQCPYSRKAATTLAALREKYGPKQLRIAWKNNPLPNHDLARGAHEIAETAFELRGDKGFWRFYDAVYLTEAPFTITLYKDAGIAAGVKGDDVLAARTRTNAKIDADLELGKRIGVKGTPNFYINGIYLSGAQPLESFVKVIDPELEKARELLSTGAPRADLYASRATSNFKQAAEVAHVPKHEEPPDTTVWRVPIGHSPTRGRASAPVTIVEFGDFQCPFCARVQPTLDAVRNRYGDKVRFVFKDNPLPFHKSALPAALVGRAVKARGGDAAFWKFHDAVYADQQHLDAADLEDAARKAGVAGVSLKALDANVKLHDDIEDDMELAEDVTAQGTPTFFINGRKLVGAQPIDKFAVLVDEELAKVAAWKKQGNAEGAYYDAIMKTATARPPTERASVPAPTKANPSKGPANAKIVVEYFSDFQCPFCRKVEGTLGELEKAYPGQIKIVWRNMPLSFHADAELAAEAAMEAFAQQGSKGFWAMHDLLFAEPVKLDRKSLDADAARMGLDVGRFDKALDGHVHVAEIEADQRIAANAKVTGTPAFVINGYFLSGAQPLSKFKRVVKLAQQPGAAP
ncbi:MAG TPA: thioredoxin domain-containing protein [Byssovorax sp.]|jgi:protein-disulfide isomerase